MCVCVLSVFVGGGGGGRVGACVGVCVCVRACVDVLEVMRKNAE